MTAWLVAAVVWSVALVGAVAVAVLTWQAGGLAAAVGLGLVAVLAVRVLADLVDDPPGDPSTTSEPGE